MNTTNLVWHIRTNGRRECHVDGTKLTEVIARLEEEAASKSTKLGEGLKIGARSVAEARLAAPDEKISLAYRGFFTGEGIVYVSNDLMLVTDVAHSNYVRDCARVNEGDIQSTLLRRKWLVDPAPLLELSKKDPDEAIRTGILQIQRPGRVRQHCGSGSEDSLLKFLLRDLADEYISLASRQAIFQGVEKEWTRAAFEKGMGLAGAIYFDTPREAKPIFRDEEPYLKGGNIENINMMAILEAGPK